MKFDWSIAAVMGLVVVLGIAATFGKQFHGVELAIFIAVLALVGLFAMSAIIYYKNKSQKKGKPAAAGTAGAAEAGASEIDTLVKEADQRLAQANAGATTANLPVIFVIGDKSTAKTSTVMNSGIEPELLAGNLYQDGGNVIAPTRAANLWFARKTALVEAGGPILGDPGNWLKLVKRLQPGKLKSLKGGAQSPRAVLLCVSLESFMQQGGADAMVAAARYLQQRLAEVAQTLGIRFPVYILFTKTDRVPFFTEFVNTFNSDEASQVFGVTVPIRSTQQTGVYADEETRRLTAYYDNLFYSLCDKRTVFPPRDTEVERICGAYEYPREMRKLRDLMVRFMVDVCRPSQLTTSPFLRGFYFSGVRPVVISDAAPMVAASRPREQDFEGASSATGMFRVGKQAEMRAQQAVAQPMAASRKVPQWMFLGRLFNDIILGDTTAMMASGSSVKVSALRRALLIAATVLGLLLAGLFLWSFMGNRGLENTALTAAKTISPTPLVQKDVASLDSLNQLETLRQTLDQLTQYEKSTPMPLTFGLYHGSQMLPEVRRLYYNRFRALLWSQTESGLLAYMKGLPVSPAEGDSFIDPYNNLKAYLLTTGKYTLSSRPTDPSSMNLFDNGSTNYDTSLQGFLGNLLWERWNNRQPAIDNTRSDLAKKQFQYYAGDLGNGNPYFGLYFNDKPEVDTVTSTRRYLQGFKGPKLVYMTLRGAVASKTKPISFNQYADGSAEVILSTHPVEFEYTTPGAKYMTDQIAKANFGGEKWVMGPDYRQTDDNTATVDLQKGVTDLYVHDYIKEWQTVLLTSRFVSYKDANDAVKKLGILTDRPAPMMALFAWVSQNTNVDLPHVKDAFQSARWVQPPTNSTYDSPPVDQYQKGLYGLHNVLDKWVKDGAKKDAVADWQNAAQSAKDAWHDVQTKIPADKVSDLPKELQKDVQADLPRAIRDLMLEPIKETDALAPKPGQELNEAGGKFCTSFNQINRKFPFTKGKDDNWRKSNELTLAEVDSIFKPGTGKLADFYKQLSNFVDCDHGDCQKKGEPPFTMNQNFLAFLTQGMKWSRSLYTADGTGPSFKYSLRPKKAAEFPTSFTIEVNGESWTTPGDESHSYVWPGSGSTQNFKVLLNPVPIPAESFQDQWSVFRFLAQSISQQGHDFVMPYHKAQAGSGAPDVTYTFTVETDVPIFSSYLATCEPKVVLVK